MNADNRDKIIERIRLLRDRTTANGCTEAEALAAAELLQRLITAHNVTITDVEVGNERCHTEYLATGRRAPHECQYALAALADAYNCKAWISKGPNSAGNIATTFCLFGLPADVEAASYLLAVIKASMDRETVSYLARCRTIGAAAGRSGSHAFMLGMAMRIAERLRALSKSGRQEVIATTGRDLVPIKNAVVDAQWKEQDIRLTSNRSRTSIGDRGAYSAGKAAGDRVSFNRGIGQSGGTALLGSK